ncbi:MAG: rhomboid family intramembrane serine protease [Spirochaetota bacterium]
MRITYNAPVTLTFALTSSLVLLADQLTGAGITEQLFAVRGTMDPANPLDYVRLVTHVLGHANWAHLVSNFAFILLLGPILEEKYGSSSLFVMMLITAVATGLLNVLLFSTGLLGASGIVFMMILLGSFTNFRRGEIPLTFILVVVLYLAREVVTAFQSDQISQFAHIAGGFLGSLFGFLRPRRSA